jgi:hypothetical protein
MKILNIYKSLIYISYQFMNYLNNYIIMSFESDLKFDNEIPFNNYIIRNVESKSEFDFDIENQINKNDCQIMDRSYDGDNSYGFFVIIDR